ncbi:MAG: TerB family tellurite resistance protein [Euryarchaeota archaeon]|nr:TerB family tellurite resistance protein [Euryarchaeota archaeon]
MTLELGPGNIPDLIAGLGMLALAALLLWVAPTNRVHRAFALLQVVNGMASLVYVGHIGFEGDGSGRAVVLENVGSYFVLSLPFAAAFFTLRFLDPDGGSRASRPLAWCLLFGVVLVLGAFAWDHGLAYSLREDGTFALGPLGLAWFAYSPTFGFMALLFALRARHAGSAPRREGLILASLAFTLLAAYWGAALLVGSSFAAEWFFRDPAGHPVVRSLVHTMPLVGAVTVLATLGAMFGLPPLRGDPATNGSRRLLAFGAGVSALTGVFVVGLLLVDPVRFESLPLTLDGVWRVGTTLLLAYALLKRQVFDVEVRLRFAISRSTVAAVFIAVFFVASEAAQEFFGDTLGSTYVGIAAAGALVFAIAPLQRAADRLAAKAVPVAEPSSLARDTYRHAVRVAFADGTMSRDEERALARLQQGLGLGPEEALDVRDEIEAERGPVRTSAGSRGGGA